MRGEEDFIRNMLSVVDYNTFKYFGGEEAQINYSKPYNTHLSHIASFITAYTRLNTLEQLMNMPTENISCTVQYKALRQFKSAAAHRRSQLSATSGLRHRLFKRILKRNARSLLFASFRASFDDWILLWSHLQTEP